MHENSLKMSDLHKTIHITKQEQNVNTIALQFVTEILAKVLPLTLLFRHEGLFYHNDNIRNKEVLQISAILK